MRERERAWRKAVNETRGEEGGGERGREDVKKGRRFLLKNPTCWLEWSTFKDVRRCFCFGKSRTNHQW